MVARRRINLDRLPEQILVYLHQQFFDDSITYVTFSEIRAAFEKQPANAVRLELDALVDDGFVDQKTERRFRQTSFAALSGMSPTTPTYWEAVDGYKLSKKGVMRTEDFEDEHFVSLQTGITLPIPNSSTRDNSDEWEPLPLDRNTETARDAIQKAHEALKEIEQNNGYASSEPEERNGIVETIKGTLVAIKTGMPSRRAIAAGLVAPFRYIARKFADASMGESAKIALAAILKWLF